MKIACTASDFKLSNEMKPFAFVASWNINSEVSVNAEILRDYTASAGFTSKVPMPTSRTSITRACRDCVQYLNKTAPKKTGKYDFKKVEDDTTLCKYTVYRVGTDFAIRDLNMNINSHIVWSKSGTQISCDGAEKDRLHDLYVHNLSNCNEEDLRVFARKMLIEECRAVPFHDGVYIVTDKLFSKLTQFDTLLTKFSAGSLDIIPLYPVQGQVEMITEKLVLYVQQKMSDVREKLSVKMRADAFATLNNDVADMNSLVEDYKAIVQDIAVFGKLKKEMDDLSQEILKKL